MLGTRDFNAKRDLTEDDVLSVSSSAFICIVTLFKQSNVFTNGTAKLYVEFY